MVNSSNHSEGVLIDLDVAARVDEHGDHVGGIPFPPAGTLETRAFDLVSAERPRKAYYRHDLESFFYTLLWIQALYKDGKRIANPDERVVMNFKFNLSWSSTQRGRQGFLLSHDDPLIRLHSPDVICHKWTSALHQMLGEALDARFSAVVKARDGGGMELDEKAFDDLLTYERFMSILNR